MKTNFKKLCASIAIVASLAGGSLVMSASAADAATNYKASYVNGI